MPFNLQNARTLLDEFRLHDLFIEELGWSQPPSLRPEDLEVDGKLFRRTCIAQASRVPVFEIAAADGEIPNADTRLAVYRSIAAQFAENLLIFLNGDRTRSMWYWAKREGAKLYPRLVSFLQGEPTDLILSRIGGLYLPPEKFEGGDPPVVEIAALLQQSLDVETVTNQFYKEYQILHLEFVVQYITGIDKEADRRWYASVVLNRLMFVYFLQKKAFIGSDVYEYSERLNYLQLKLEESKQQGSDRFFGFLQTLFFEGFAKSERPDSIDTLLGQVPYLNGGLFLRHRIEIDYPNITIADTAFEKVFALFSSYSWNLDDSEKGNRNEINPDVLGYIFEKYINQKAFGAYYTRLQITEYLCDRTINKLILDRVNQVSDRPFETIGDLLVKLDAKLCRRLIYGDDAILKTLSLLDPACGSGAFLIAAMKTLMPIYNSVIGTIKNSNDYQLISWLRDVERDHPSLSYFIKKRIITDNLYGVDIMEEAIEIAKLRLFLALVSSAQTADDLEPLPNIDFNIMAGNSLIGLLQVDEERFDAAAQPDYVQGNLLQPLAAQSYRSILDEKNRSVDLYKRHSFLRHEPNELESTEQESRLQILRKNIDDINEEAQAKLNQLLLDEFSGKLQIRYEEAQLTGRSKKRLLKIADIEVLKPFHWGYHFDRVLDRGGFDAIITNPPWEVFKPNAKEFFLSHSDLVSKKKMDIKAFEKEQKKLLQDAEIEAVWLDYLSEFPHISAYYRSAEQYKNQISVVNGKKAGTDINLYKIFLEQCFNLLNSHGCCGILIPSGVYTDLGTKQLREMLFSQTSITDLFGLSNEKFIFDSVHHSFKIAILTFEKGKSTQSFHAAFRINPREAIRTEELEIFLTDRANQVHIPIELIRRLSPDSLSVMEFKSDRDIVIAEKMLKFPLLGEKIADKWNLRLTAEFHMTNDSRLFKQQSGMGRLPLYEGKMIHQFTHEWGKPKYWLNELEARQALLKRNEIDEGQILSY